MNYKRKICFLAATLLILGVNQPHAAEFTWADSAGNTTWTTNSTAGSTPTSASWVGGVAPANSTTVDTAIFTSVANAQPTLTVLTRIAGVDFQMADGGLVMSGGGGAGQVFQVGTGGINSSLQTSGVNTIANARIAAFSGPATWSFFSSADTASTSTFTLDSTIELGQNLTIIGQRNAAAGNVGIINFERAITAGSNVRTVTINSTSANNTVNLNGVNTYLGVTTVNGGIVNVQNNQSAATGGWNIQTPDTAGVPVATVNFLSGSTIGVASNNKIQIGRAANSGQSLASTLNVAGTVDNNGTLQMERASSLNLNSGAVWNQGGNMVITARGGTLASVNVNAGAEMTYTGTTTVQLNRAASSGGVGGLFIDSTGVFTTGRGFEATVNTGDPANGNGRVSLSNGGTLKLSADVTDLSTQVHFELGAGGGVIDNNGFNATLSGVVTGLYGINRTGITGTGGLTSTGTGTLTLSGNNTYTGATTVNAGSLILGASASVASSSVLNVASGATFDVSAVTGGFSVVAGQTLRGSGTVVGHTAINGILAPGNSIGTLAIAGNVTWNADNNWIFQLGGAGPSIGNTGTSDLLAITGGNDFLKGTGGSFTFDFAGTGDLGWYKLVEWTGGSTTFATPDFTGVNLGGGFTSQFFIEDDALYLNVVPEPSTYALLALGAAGLGAHVIRRRRRA